MAISPSYFSYECFNKCTYEGFVRNSIRLATATQGEPRQNWADSGTPKIQVNPTKVLVQMNHPVCGM